MHYVYPSNSGAGVTVYVIDGGVNVKHNEFEGRAKWGKTFVKDEGHTDLKGHGTHVAGTIASRRYGVAKKASIIAVKTHNAQGRGATSRDIAGVEWAVNDARRLNSKRGHKGTVFNLSLGGGRSRAMEDVVNNAVRAGMHVVTAAGNDNVDACTHSPASASLPITVAASTKDDTLAGYSNYGRCVDVIAPGSAVLSTGINGRDSTAIKSGTSMATPHVSGLVAHFLSIYPHRTFDPQALSEDSLSVPSDSYFASALIAAQESLYEFLTYFMPSAHFGLYHRTINQAESQVTQAHISPQKMKKALLALAVKGKISKPLPRDTPNILAYNNYIHGQPDIWEEQQFDAEIEMS